MCANGHSSGSREFHTWKASAETRTRVLIATSTFPRQPGDGKARFVLDLAKALQTSMDVEVLAPQTPGSKRVDIVEGVSVRRFSYLYPSRAQVLTSGHTLAASIRENWMAKLQAPIFLIAQTIALLRSVRRFRPAVVNCHWLVPQGLTAVLARVFVRFPIVLHIHAADVYFLQRIPGGGLLARFVVRRSAAVLADGSHVRDALDQLLGYASGASLRPMGVWVHQFETPDTPEARTPEVPREFVLFVGRLVEKKGVEYLIRAMRSVRQTKPHVELLIVGDGPLHSELSALVDDLEISSFVHFMGPQDHRTVAALMRQAAVIAVPSIIDSKGETEGMPTVVVEAMAAGTRVVGSAVDGIPDVLRDASNGWLVEPRDYGSLAAGILTALNHPDSGRVAERGQATAKQHDWPVVAEEYALVLQQAANG